LFLRNICSDHADLSVAREQPFERFVVHERTPVSVPDPRPNWINIDTGAFATGRLDGSAIMQLPEEHFRLATQPRISRDGLLCWVPRRFPDQRSLLDLLLAISRIAQSRRAAARLSYRSTLRNSGSALRTASAVRSGSWVGIVAKGSTGSRIAGGLPRGALPSKANSRYK
jgi:hypothetical protein